MAIKGKSKPRARRVTTNAPKPVTVVPKKPFLARRWVRFTALGLLLLVVGTILFFTWKSQRDRDELEEKRAVLVAFQDELEAPIASVRQALPTGVALFSEMRSALTQFKDGGIDPSTVIQDATGWEETSAQAIEELEEIAPSRVVRSEGLPLSMIDAHQYLVSAVKAYHEAATALRTAAQVGPGDQREALIGVAERLMDAGDELVASAYAKINNERFLLGIEESPLA